MAGESQIKERQGDWERRVFMPPRWGVKNKARWSDGEKLRMTRHRQKTERRWLRWKIVTERKRKQFHKIYPWQSNKKNKMGSEREGRPSPWFSIGGDTVPHWTFDNVWGYLMVTIGV
jgi:hypothetical protein